MRKKYDSEGTVRIYFRQIFVDQFTACISDWLPIIVFKKYMWTFLKILIVNKNLLKFGISGQQNNGFESFAGTVTPMSRWRLPSNLFMLNVDI